MTSKWFIPSIIYFLILLPVLTLGSIIGDPSLLVSFITIGILCSLGYFFLQNT